MSLISKLLGHSAVLLAAWTISGTAIAGTQTFQVVLSGDQESPPVVTSGSGTATVTLDDVSGAVTVVGTYTSLAGDCLAAHIHTGAPGANGPAILGLTVSGGTSGTVTGTGTLSATDVTNMLAGLTYLNYHSVVHPGGEVRGQICPTNASWTNYDAGWPGTAGIPTLTASDDPIQGTLISLDIGNSLGANTSGFLFVGFSRTCIPTNLGGKILVTPFLIVPLVIPAAGLSLPAPISNDPNLCGFLLDLQVLEIDGGASKGVSFTPGLELQFGS